MTALILAQIPDPHVPAAITAYQLPLVRMDHHIIDRHAVHIVALYISTACIPYLDRTVFRRCDEPLALAVECYACDVGGVAVEGEDGVGVGGFDVVELDGVVAGGGEVALVGRDAEAVDLRVGVGDCARADAAERFPEALE